jgi:hypothetical protein
VRYWVVKDYVICGSSVVIKTFVFLLFHIVTVCASSRSGTSTNKAQVHYSRGLSRQIWHAYQDRSITALVYHPQRTAISRLKVYTNIKLQDATPRIEDSICIHEGSNNPKIITAAREASTLQDLDLRAGKPSNSHRIFSGILDSLTPLTLKMSWQGFNTILSTLSTLQSSTSANEDNLYLRQKQVFDATKIITGELEEQPLRPNSNLVSTPLTSTLRNLGTRFCLRREEQ